VLEYLDGISFVLFFVLSTFSVLCLESPVQMLVRFAKMHTYLFLSVSLFHTDKKI